MYAGNEKGALLLFEVHLARFCSYIASLAVYQRSDNKGEWHGWRGDVLSNSVVKGMVVIHGVLKSRLPLKSFRSTG